MSEKVMRQNVVRWLRPLHAIAVENPVLPGTPDVNYIGGWIELKMVDSWPVGEDTPLRLPHFTQHQRLWLRTRWKKGGKAFLLLQVGNDWLLFDGITAFEHVGKQPKKFLIQHCLSAWFGVQPGGELIQHVR